MGASSPLGAPALGLLDDFGKITLAEAVRATGANRNTLKVRFKELVEAELLCRHGSGRGVYYTRGRVAISL